MSDIITTPPRYIDENEIDWDKIEYEYGSRNTVVVACEIVVEKTPTADVAPVIHAYPEDYLDRYKCSNCKVEIEGFYMHYCYNCGALLDWEKYRLEMNSTMDNSCDECCDEK